MDYSSADMDYSISDDCVLSTSDIFKSLEISFSVANVYTPRDIRSKQGL